ncbi:MAG: MBL fold metallo-hydrolase [Gammaproteobacteria bacterium]
MKPQVQGFFDPATYTISYVVSDRDGGRAAIIDPVLDFDPKSGRTATASADALIAYVRDHDLGVDWILETHAHADHLSAAPYLKEILGGKVAIGEHITTVQETMKGVFNAGDDFAVDGSQFDHLFSDGETFSVGEVEARVLHTPGHTPACITYVIGDAVFVGDTLFMPDYGTARCDFPGGDARELYGSIHRLLELPDDYRMFMCHDYMSPTRDFHAWETTVGEERRHNVHVHEGIDADDFVAVREARDKTLDMPVLILPSVQVNMRAGEKPPAEDNGVSYLKLPMDLL